MSIKGNTLKEFDFEKVAKVMNLVGWTYFNTLGKVVTVDELKEVASYCIDALLSDKKSMSVETGGFQAKWEYFDESLSSRFVRLSFVLETVAGFEDSAYV